MSSLGVHATDDNVLARCVPTERAAASVTTPPAGVVMAGFYEYASNLLRVNVAQLPVVYVADCYINTLLPQQTFIHGFSPYI